MIRWINKISHSIKVYNYLNKLSLKDKQMLFRAMYWYTSSLGIPPNEFDILKQNEWVIEMNNDEYTWSPKTLESFTLLNCKNDR